ncbi:MAG: DMT family transporter [Bacteroidota bacterium]
MNWIFYLMALGAGLGMTTQAGVNSQLRQAVINPVMASLISFAVGTITLLVFVFTVGTPTPSLSSLGQIPWWKWTGGLIGACYVTIVIMIAPKIGAANMIGLIVAAQLISAIMFDHFGLLGFPVHTISVWRIAGALFIISGVYLILKY